MVRVKIQGLTSVGRLQDMLGMLDKRGEREEANEIERMKEESRVPDRLIRGRVAHGRVFRLCGL